ncbi:MAG: ATP-binding protein [Clostridia bacterium]|nr:ATP-binding protein [Clostridia bacterium]
MAYNKQNYLRVRENYRTKYQLAEEEAARRTAELHQKSPALRALDRELSKTGVKIAMAALGTGEEYKEKLAAVEKENLALQARRAQILAELGYPAEYTKPPYECHKCNDSGFVGTKMCECMRRDLVLAAFESSGIGALLRTQSFDSFKAEYYPAGEERELMMRNLALLREYAEKFSVQSDSLIFCGATGLGKTHLSTALARRVIERGFDVYYTTALQMFADFEHARFGTDMGMESVVSLDRYTSCELLILDDLGTEVSNQFTNSCLYMVLNERINKGLPTVISTNLTGKEIKARYTDRIASRILGDFKPMLFVGVDVRRLKLTEKA